jgi:hypothetical protein
MIEGLPETTHLGGFFIDPNSFGREEDRWNP